MSSVGEVGHIFELVDAYDYAREELYDEILRQTHRIYIEKEKANGNHGLNEEDFKATQFYDKEIVKALLSEYFNKDDQFHKETLLELWEEIVWG